MRGELNPSQTYEQALARAARLWGIEPEYSDTWGRTHVTAPGTERAILGALGVDAATREALDRAIEERTARDWENLLPPVVVLGEGAWANGIAVSVPVRLGAARARVEFRWEGGGAEYSEVQLDTLRNSGRSEIRGENYLRKQVPLPEKVRLGYHDFEIRIENGSGEPLSAATRLILCPDRAFEPEVIREGRRTAGIAIALYGLRSGRNWGCGDFTDLEAFIDWASEEAGAAFVGLNPLHAIPNRQPFNISPYLPASTFYKNPIYLDIGRVEDFRRSRRAQARFRTTEVESELERLRGSEFVEYERVWALKLSALKLAFVRFLRAEYARDTDRARQFRDFCDREGCLLNLFAIYCALEDWLHRRNPDLWIWTEWPEEYQDPESAATREFARKHRRLVLFYKYAQWQVDLQLNRAQRHAREKGMGIGLFHDLALATDRFGGDLWADRPFYVFGCRVGAPPDTFSPKGQDWSFPPPNSERHREDRYHVFAESIRKNCRHGGALRIDHVMRFFRLYWIPEGSDPAHGAYVRDRFDELLHILALESVRQRVAMVGEDLGTVTPEIRRTLERFGIFGYRVPYFEKNNAGEFKPPREYSERALVSSSTHDLPTLAGFWTARDVEARRQAGLLPEAGYREQLAARARDKQRLLDALSGQKLLPEAAPRRAEQIQELTGELHNAIVGWLAQAPSKFMALNQEDLLKEIEQQNLPATTSEHPNWRRKMRLSVEELRSGAAADYTSMLRHWLEKTGRLSNRNH